jgi:hypothetical protein
MDSETIIYIAWGALLGGILGSLLFARWRRQLRTERSLTTELLKGYFQGHMPAHQLGQRTREITTLHFLRSATFYSLVISAFQGAVDAEVIGQAHAKEDERKLMSLLAALKKEFGLADLYQIEAWRSGRE